MKERNSAGDFFSFSYR